MEILSMLLGDYILKSKIRVLLFIILISHYLGIEKSTLVFEMNKISFFQAVILSRKS